MDKSAHRNQGKTRGTNLSTPLTGIISDPAKAQELVGEAQEIVSGFGAKAIPAIRKFTRENWKQIALVSAGVAVLAGGTFFYLSQKKARVAKNLTH